MNKSPADGRHLAERHGAGDKILEGLPTYLAYLLPTYLGSHILGHPDRK